MSIESLEKEMFRRRYGEDVYEILDDWVGLHPSHREHLTLVMQNSTISVREKKDCINGLFELYRTGGGLIPPGTTETSQRDKATN